MSLVSGSRSCRCCSGMYLLLSCLYTIVHCFMQNDPSAHGQANKAGWIERGYNVIEHNSSEKCVWNLPKPGTRHNGIFKGGVFETEMSREDMTADEMWQPDWVLTSSDVILVRHTAQLLNMVMHPSAAASRLFSEFAHLWARGGQKPWMIWLACKWLIGNKDAKKNAYSAFPVARCYMHAWEK